MISKPNGIYNTVCPRDCFGGCSLKVTIENGNVINVTGNKNNKNSDGKICSKGVSYVKRLYHPERLRHPLLKDKKTNEFNRISWNEAIALITDKLTGYKEKYGSESILYLMGWGHMGVLNDYAKSFWNQFGNISSVYGSLCMAAGKTAVTYTYGDKVKHNHNDDLQNAKLIIVWGANPANTNIHRMRNITKSVKNGTKLIVIDPRVSETMIKGAVRIHPRGGTDGLLALGIGKLLIERGICDYDFINKNVFGFDEYKSKLKEYSLEEIAKITEVSLEQINEIVDAIAKNPIYALVSGSGKARYSNGGQTERCICVLPALTANVGVSGGGLYFSDAQQPKVKWKNYPTDKYNLNEKIHVGTMAYELDKQKPKIKAMWMERVNPLTSTPDVNSLKKAMEDIEFIVVVEHFMTDTTKVADLILPASMFAEKNDIMTIYGDSYIQLMQKIVEPLEECKSEAEIYRMLGEQLKFDLGYLPVIDAEAINQLLKDNNIDVTYEELTKEPYLFSEYNKIAYEDLKFETPSGKIELYSKQMEQWGQSPLPTYNEPLESKYSSKDLYEKYPIHLLSIHAAERSNSQFKEMSLGSTNNIPTIQINTIDAEKRNIIDGDLIKVFNDRGELEIIAEVGEIIKKGTANIYAGWGEAYKASVNKLLLGRKTDIGDGTGFHDCLVDIIKIKEGN